MPALKNLIVVAVLVASSFAAFAQGTVNFANGAAGVNAPVKMTNIANTVTNNVSSPFVAQLWAGTNNAPLNSLTPIGSVVTFSTGPNAGYFFGGTFVVSNLVAGGSVAELVVRVWNPNEAPDFATAKGAAGNTWGESLPVSVTLGTPPSGTVPNLVGLQSFFLITNPTLVPEPSAVALIGIGGAGLFFLRRKKS